MKLYWAYSRWIDRLILWKPLKKALVKQHGLDIERARHAFALQVEKLPQWKSLGYERFCKEIDRLR